MFWLIICLLGIVCAIVCIGAFAVWITTGAIISLLECVEKSLVNLGNEHMIVGLLYVVPAWLLISAIVQLSCLAYSFVTTVFLR
jgi:hypothetical protein